MSQQKKLGWIFVTMIFWQFTFAFITAPHACEWGLAAYFWLGVIALISMIVLPFFVLRSSGFSIRLAVSVAYGFAEIVLWTAGILIAEMQLICRLF